MTTTTNYGYTVIVGSDTPVNIQNDIAPNFTAIDADLKAVSDSAITVATHTYSGGVHALVRADADRDVMYFVATSDMATGDTFTVDGVSVTARLVNGEALKTGSFVINNNVFAILIGTVLNIYAENPSVNTASGTTYDNSASGLTATDVQDAIDELKTIADGKLDESVLATVQTTLIASRNYAIGDQFMYNGLLYKATSAISSGTSIIIGTNATASDPVVDQILASSSGERTIATASANQTYSAQLTYLKTYFDALTAEEQRASKLIIGSRTLTGDGFGEFFAGNASIGGGGTDPRYGFLGASLTNSVYVTGYVHGSGVSINNNSANNDTSVMTLIVA